MLAHACFFKIARSQLFVLNFVSAVLFFLLMHRHAGSFVKALEIRDNYTGKNKTERSRRSITTRLPRWRVPASDYWPASYLFSLHLVVQICRAKLSISRLANKDQGESSVFFKKKIGEIIRRLTNAVMWAIRLCVMSRMLSILIEPAWPVLAPDRILSSLFVSREFSVCCSNKKLH